MSDDSLVLDILLLIASWYFSTLAHELGHLLYAMANGFKFKWLIVGPIGIKEIDSKIKIYFERNINYWGGISLACPSAEDEKDIDVYANMLLAGPIISLVLSVLCLVPGIIFMNSSIILFGMVSFGIFIATIIPIETAMFYNDYSRYRILRKKDNRSCEEYSVIKLTFNLTINECYKYMNFYDIQRLQSSSIPKNKYLGTYYAYCYYDEICDEEHKQIELEKLNSVRKTVPEKYSKMVEN